MVTVISSFAKTKLGGEGLSVNRRSNRQRSIIPSWCTSVSINSTASAAHSVHHNIKVIFMQNNFRVQFIFLLLFKPFYFSFPRSTPARYLNLLEECRNGVVINLYCITWYYTILSIASVKTRKQPGNSTTKNLNSFIYSPYIHLTFSILIVGHSANFTFQNECSRRYINPPWVISTRYWIIKEGLICQDLSLCRCQEFGSNQLNRRDRQR